MKRVWILDKYQGPGEKLIEPLEKRFSVQFREVNRGLPSFDKFLPDLVLLRFKREHTIAFCERLQCLVLPEPAMVRKLRNRAFTSKWLNPVLPLPPFFIGSPTFLSKTVPADAYPLVRKLNDSSSSKGVRILRSQADLTNIPRDKAIYTESLINGHHMTLYFFDDQIFACTKEPFGTDLTERLSHLPEGAEKLVRIYRRATGARWGKLDVVINNSDPFVVDFGMFPSFRSLPQWPLKVTAIVEDILNSKNVFCKWSKNENTTDRHARCCQ